MIEIRFIKTCYGYCLEYKKKKRFRTKWVLFGKYHGSIGGYYFLQESSTSKKELLNNFLKHKETRRDCVTIRQHATIKEI